MPVTIPKDIGLEAKVIGGLLKHPEAQSALSSLTAEDFAHEPHQHILSAMLWLEEQGRSVSVVALKLRLRNIDLFEQIGGDQAIDALAELEVSSENISEFSSALRDIARVRRVVLATLSIADRSTQALADVDQFLAESEAVIFKATKREREFEAHPIKPHLKSYFRLLDQRFKASGGVTGVPSGLRRLDEVTTGFKAGDFTLITGVGGMGKTTLCLTIARNASIREKVPVLYVSPKRTAIQRTEALLCSEARIDIIRIWRGKLTRACLAALTYASDSLAQSPLCIADAASLDTDALRCLVRSFAQSHISVEAKKPGLIIVDDLQGIRARPQDNRYRGTIAQDLKAIAQESGCALIGSLKLDTTFGPKGEAQGFDVELPAPWRYEDADVGLRLYRPIVHDSKASIDELQIYVSPNSNGPTAFLSVGFDYRYRRCGGLPGHASATDEAAWAQWTKERGEND